MQDSSSGIGETLRRAREARRLSLGDLERLTKIRGAYLAALEEERFDALPPHPYPKGFIRAYARLVGLDPDPLVTEFEARVPPPPAPLSRAVEIPLEPAAPVPRWRRLLTYFLWVALLGALYLGYIGYAQLREFARPLPAATPAPAVGAVGTPAPRPVATPGAGPAATPAPAVGSPAPRGAVTVTVTTTGTSWFRVIADGERVFQGILDAGESRTWTAERAVAIRIGNAAAVALTVNGKPLGPLGGPGKVVELRFPSPEEP